MTDFAGIAQRLVSAYNAKDFGAMEQIIAPDIDFAHFNRDFVLHDRKSLIDVLRLFAETLVPDRHFLEPERAIVHGKIVIREGYYVGTATQDLPGFAPAGRAFKLKFCSVMRFDDEGLLVEWKDYG